MAVIQIVWRKKKLWIYSGLGWDRHFRIILHTFPGILNWTCPKSALLPFFSDFPTGQSWDFLWLHCQISPEPRRIRLWLSLRYKIGHTVAKTMPCVFFFLATTSRFNRFRQGLGASRRCLTIPRVALLIGLGFRFQKIHGVNLIWALAPLPMISQNLWHRDALLVTLSFFPPNTSTRTSNDNTTHSSGPELRKQRVPVFESELYCYL